MNNLSIDDLISMLVQMKDTKSLEINEAKKLFFSCLKAKNSREQTIAYYKNIFYTLDKFFEENGITNTDQITDDLLRKLISTSQNKNLSANYINKLIGAIKYLFTLLSDNGYIEEKYFKVKKLAVEEKRINDLDSVTIGKIFSNLDSFNLKDQLLIQVLFDTGVRRTELLNIKLSNIDFEKNTILLETTKTGVLRVCFFTDKCKLIMKEYLNKYKPLQFLFEGNAPGKKYSISTFGHRLEKIKVCLNLTSLSAHQFRHTFGTRIYNNSLDIETTRELLGHKDYSMTKRYIHHSKDRLRKKYEQFNV